MRRMVGVGALVVVWVCLLGGWRLGAQGVAPTKEWTWKDGHGRVRTRAELDEILRLIKNRVTLLRQQEYPDLDLEFDESVFALRGADLTGAHLFRAELSGEYLTDANLAHTDFQLADLSNAYLDGTDLTGTFLEEADLTGAIYEPKQPPPVASIAEAKGLDELKFDSNPSPLSALKRSFSEAGYLRQAKLVSASLHRHRESPFERLLFDWTCEWGADWVHPLKLLGWLCLFSAPLYWVGLHLRGRGGLYVVATGQRVVTSRGREHWRRVWVARSRRLSRRERRWLGPLPARRWRTWKIAMDVWVRRWIVAEIEALGTAFLFSMMAALNLGFHDFNFGRWIRMLQPREFDLRARGWMRVAAGVQSLIGLYLVALSLLSYFGHPFD